MVGLLIRFQSGNGDVRVLPDTWASPTSSSLPRPVCSPATQPRGFASGSHRSTELGQLHALHLQGGSSPLGAEDKHAHSSAAQVPFRGLGLPSVKPLHSLLSEALGFCAIPGLGSRQQEWQMGPPGSSGSLWAPTTLHNSLPREYPGEAESWSNLPKGKSLVCLACFPASASPSAS